MTASLYIGKQIDASSGALGAPLELDPADLLTHGLIVGMTGSGKTGLAVGLIEETLRQGVPVLAIDPKGDLADLLLLFKNLDGPSFTPWVDPEAARRVGKTPEALGEETAAAWKKGLADWGLAEADMAALEGARDAVIYTPGSTSGVSLNILQSLDAPTVPFDSEAEDLRDEIAGIASGLLGLLGITADPIQSREHILLSALIENAWRKGQGLSLESLVTAVADPPFDKLGALPVETVYPAKDRRSLMMSLNNLLASPSFAVFRQGEPLDVGGLLRAPDGRPRLSVVYTAHLSDEERLFVTALLLDKVKTWIRRQGGTSGLRALVYMDEVYGYFPPHPANPPTKRPLLTLLKQARAQGLGVVLATQNPVDLDYKALTNMGTWIVGTLQTEQDRARLREGLLGAGADSARLDALLSATRKRVFLLHDVHRSGMGLVHSRWTMSYLRGPLTPDEIERVMAGRGAPRPGPQASAPAATAGPPVLPSPLRPAFFKKYGGEMGEAHLLVKYAVRYKGAGESLGVRAYRLGGSTAAEIFETEPLILDEGTVSAEAPAGLRYGDLPAFLAQAGAKGLERAIKDRLPDKLEVTLCSDPVTRSASAPGETREAFAARLQAAGGGASTQKLQDQIDKKKRDLAIREQELSGRKTEKWTAVGTAILSNIGLFMGRKRTISGASAVLTKNRLENTAEARVEALRAEVADLESQLTSVSAVDPARFEEKTLVPSTGDVSVLRYDILWVY
jgi:Helicase HerA, central domain